MWIVLISYLCITAIKIDRSYKKKVLISSDIKL